ncbi:MAG: hypothetical protein U9Q83_06750, partial [Bacteroidota bacterium]|nr:hypothetical protein [Bacteroidota bacterium]
MAIVIDENLEPITLRNLESLFVDLTMKITPDNPNGTIPSDWQAFYELTVFQDETNIVAQGTVSKSADDLKFELRVGYDITE